MPFVPKSFNNTFKTVVVVARVITVVDPAQRTATDDPARAAIARTRRRHRVLMVVAALRLRQDPLAIAEYDAVFLVRIGPPAAIRLSVVTASRGRLAVGIVSSPLAATSAGTASRA
ncbi:hypothetical protein BA763_11270 [Burkholderia cenocepacia]|nr:hypothetical protein BA763_11270 [Burkholderia cenocepacia]